MVRTHSFLLGLVSALALALALPACGDDEVAPDAPDASTPDATPAEPTLDDICNASDGVYVDFFGKAFECQGALFEVILGRPLPDDAALSALCEGALGPYLEDGTVVLGNRADLAACEAFIAALDCESFAFDTSNPCTDLISGTLAEGADCDANDQCMGNRYCAGGGVDTCGTCSDKLADGQECDDGSQCLNGYCREVEDAPSVCDTFGEIGDACVSSQDCIGTTVCDPTTDKCVAPPTSWSVDDPCSTFIFDCGGPGADLYCHPATETCKQWLAVGDTCEQTTLPADFCNLWDNDSCQDTGGGPKCTAPTIAPDAGDACGFFTDSKCGTDLVCDLDDGVCETVIALGGDCSGANTTCDIFLECVAGECQFGEYTGMCPAP